MRVLTIAAVSLFAMLSQSAGAERLGEHPAVMIKRHAAAQSPQPAYMDFYMHPAHLDLLMQAPAQDEAVATESMDSRRKVAATSLQRAGSTAAAN